MKFSEKYKNQLANIDEDLKNVAIAMYETHKGLPFYVVAQNIGMDSIEFHAKLLRVKKLLGVPAGSKRQSFDPGGPIFK